MSDLDLTRPLEMARFATLRGHDLHAAAPVTIVDEPEAPGEVTEDEARHLFNGGRVVYVGNARPTPVEKPEDAALRLTTAEPLDGDKFLIRAPWLDESITVTGREAAASAAAEAVAAGVALYTSTAIVAGPEAAAVAMGGDQFDLVEAGSNGWYEITGPGLDEPERVRGRDNAEQRLAVLRGEAQAATVEVTDPLQP